MLIKYFSKVSTCTYVQNYIYFFFHWFCIYFRVKSKWLPEQHLKPFRVKMVRKIINDGVEASPGSNWCFSFAPELVGYSAPRDLHRRAVYSVCESWFLIHQDVYHDLFVCS